MQKRKVLSFSGKTVNTQILKEKAQKYCTHEFNILCSGWNKVYYGMKAAGFEGKQFFFPYSTEIAQKEIPAFYREKHEQFFGMISRYCRHYEPIDWQIDFKSGHRLSVKEHFSKMTYGTVDGADVKVSADLGRLYHFITLAKAYIVFRDIKYKNEIFAQFLDFAAFNPPGYGASWRSNMNVAIRAANIVATFDLLGWNFHDKDMEDAVFDVLYAHGKHIRENLENEGQTANHYISNLAGLLILSCYLSKIYSNVCEWFNYCINEIRKEIIKQHFQEGTHFEASTGYHCLVLEMLCGSMVYAARYEGNSTPVNICNWLKEKLGRKGYAIFQKAFSFYHNLLQPDGLIPPVGDYDSGRFFFLEGEYLFRRDYRFLLLIGSELFSYAKSFPFDDRHKEYAEILLGWEIGENSQSSLSRSAAFREMGYFIMREGRKNYILITCGPVGTNGLGGHSHNDKLAFTLMLDELDIFIDPGIYTYTSSQYFRDMYRSVKMHNTLYFKDEEPNRPSPENPWWRVPDETKCECVKWKTSVAKDIFTGRHYAYERLENGAVHQRTVEWGKTENKISVFDELLNIKGKLPVSECGFMLHSDCVITYYSEKKIHLHRKNVEIKMISDNGCWKTEPAFYSPEYGSKIYTQRLVLALPAGTGKNSFLITYHVKTKK